MSDSVQMPALGESVTEGTVTRWLKQVGDRVEVDEPLLEVSTDKVDTEIPSPVAGVVQEILVGEDETVAVGVQLAVIGDGSQPSGGGASANGSKAGQAPAEQIAAPQPTSDQVGGEREVDEKPSTDQPEPVAAPTAGQQPAEQQQDDGAQAVTMPALGESVTEGTVTRWLKQVGDDVAVDEPLLEVSTDKVDTEIPAPFAGVLQKILVAEDETVPVGTELALLGDAGGAVQPASRRQTQEAPARQQPAPQAAAQPPAEQAPPRQSVPAQTPSPRSEPAGGTAARPQSSRQPALRQPSIRQAGIGPQSAVLRPAGDDPDSSVYVTPLVRRLAAQHDIELGGLTGTGVGGRIRKQDVLDAAAAKEEAAERQRQAPPTPAAQTPAVAAPAAPAKVSELRGTTVKMSRLRRLIAQRMVESLQTSAQLTTVVEVDITRIARLRDRTKAEFQRREGVKLSFLPFFALAAVEALKQFPVVNASIDGEDVVYHAEENLGIAVDTERGLLVPVIRSAGDLNIAGIARKISDLADRARRNKISPDDLAGGTFTLTNTGSRGALFDTPILFQPQVAILGTGAVVKRPVVLTDNEGGETIAIRSMAYLALSYDHRIVDGADAARFLSTMKQRLEEGAFEV